jgi:hypothetical protein
MSGWLKNTKTPRHQFINVLNKMKRHGGPHDSRQDNFFSDGPRIQDIGFGGQRTECADGTSRSPSIPAPDF